MRTSNAAFVVSVAAALTAWAIPAAAEPPAGQAPSTQQAPSEKEAKGGARASFTAPAPPVSSGSGALTLRLSPLPGSGYPWAAPRAEIASVGPVGPIVPALTINVGSTSDDDRRPLRVAGGVVLGLGLATLFAAGVTGIVASASTIGLADECPNQRCVAGSSGARDLIRARDAALAADWLVGIGAPVTGAGTILMLYSAVVERYARATDARVFVAAGPAGGALRLTF